MQSEPRGPWWERSPGSTVADLVCVNDGSGRVAPPEQFFHYSNLGYGLLGEVVARVRGTSWEEALRERVLTPLGMSRTTYGPEGRHAQGLSVDHFAGTLTLEPHHDTASMAPAGQLWSTLDDLARWAVFLADGALDVLGRDTLDEMARPVAPATDYGLGLRLIAFEGATLGGHTGTMPGFHAAVFLDPHPDWVSGMIVLANATTGLDTREVVQRFQGERDLDEVVSPPTEPWRPSVSVPATVAAVLGLWFWGNSALELRWHNGRLQLRSTALGTVSDEFEPFGHSFIGTWGYHRGETLHARRREDGSVSHLECATFVYTRVPYDPAVAIPGGHPQD